MIETILTGRRFRRLPVFICTCVLACLGLTSDVQGQGNQCDINSPPPPCSDCDNNSVRDVCEPELLDGLLGRYYTSSDQSRFAELIEVRTDFQVDFEWGDGSPGFGVPADNFAVIWTGTIESPISGLQEIATNTDDGVRLWVDGQLVIENWTNHSTQQDIAVVDFVAGERVPIRLEYFESGGGATCQLTWRLLGEMTFSSIPQEALRPDTDIDGDGYPDQCYADCNGNGINDLVEIEGDVSADCNGNCSPDECDEFPKDIAGYWRFEGDDSLVFDSGQWELSGSLGDALRQLDVDRRYIPQTGEENRGSIVMLDEVVTIPDPDGRLRFADESFTIEAWVRLDTLSTSADDNSQRQYILQKKPLASYDSELGFSFMAQSGNIAGASQYEFGKRSGISGRELVLRFGLGNGPSINTWAITSFLEINDTDWHYVSVAWDEEAAVARFVLDDQVDVVPAYAFGRAVGQGALRVGGHTNNSGLTNQVLKGSIDEIRISRGAKRFPRLLHQFGSIDCNGNGQLDRCDIVAGISADIDGNFIPDECEDCNGNELPDAYEVEQGFSPDCNGNLLPDDCDVADPLGDCDGNGIPDDCQLEDEDCNFNGIVDACDIASGTTEDCQFDGIPDDCQLNEIVNYEYTDGFPEYGVRPDTGTHHTWMNGHRVENGANRLVAIEISYVYIDRGTPAMIYIWSDPTGDFDPSDAVLLGAVSSQVDMPDLSQGWRRQVVVLPQPIDVGVDGAVFFVGTSLRFSAENEDFPAAMDISPPTADGRSWHIGTEGPLDPNDVTANTTEYGPLDEILFSGNWDIRAVTLRQTGDCNSDGRIDVCQIESGEFADINDNGVIDDCEDCNGNGIVDSFDIADGLSLDCQPDGIPDECQMLAGDCNGDGIPDTCAPDCDADSVPDSCAIASGLSEDVDGNGVPDECEDCNLNGIPDGLDVPPNGDEPDCDGDLVPDICELGAAQVIAIGNNDGLADTSLTLGTPGWLLWMEALTVASGEEYLDAVEVHVPAIPVGSVFTFFLGTDQGAGTPATMDLKLLVDRPIPLTGEVVRIDLPDVYIGPPGTLYYIGAQYYDDTPGWNQPVALDTTDPLGLSWIAYDVTSEIDPSDVQGTSEVFSPLGDLLYEANCLLDAVVFDGTRENDADGDGVPDNCTGGGCTGDINDDDRIDGEDLTALLGEWGGTNLAFDFNDDGVVDGGDLTTLLGNWGECR